MARNKVRWGVLGAASIAIRKVIPAMQQGKWSEVVAIASRDLANAEAAGRSLGVPKAYGSYQELLDDPGIEAIYNPLPNRIFMCPGPSRLWRPVSIRLVRKNPSASTLQKPRHFLRYATAHE